MMSTTSTQCSMICCQLQLDLGDGLARIEMLRASLAAIHDRFAAVDFKGIIKELHPLTLGGVAAVSQPTIRLQQYRWAHVLVGIPPV